jgi:hypothetical protein
MEGQSLQRTDVTASLTGYKVKEFDGAGCAKIATFVPGVDRAGRFLWLLCRAALPNTTQARRSANSRPWPICRHQKQTRFPDQLFCKARGEYDCALCGHVGTGGGVALIDGLQHRGGFGQDISGASRSVQRAL